MTCEICKKNQATIHIQELIHGKKKALHICGECAEKKGLSEVGLPPGINLAELLYKISANMAGNETDAPQLQSGDDASVKPELIESPAIACPQCQWDIKKFKETGRLGCGACYETFKDILSEALKNMHRGTVHIGKTPRPPKATEPLSPAAEIAALQKRLEEHVRKEEFEVAAELRDKINGLKAKLESDGK